MYTNNIIQKGNDLLDLLLTVRKTGVCRYPAIAAFILFVSSFSMEAQAQTNWHLRKDVEGIKVYTATTAESDFKYVKVECTINASPSQLIALLADIDKEHEWVYSSKSSEILKMTGKNDFVFYSQVSVPWPCADRDYIAHIIVTQPSPTLITIDAYSEPDMLPLKDGIVRVKKHGAHWDIASLGHNQTKIVYTVNFDPAGSVPAWLTNLFVVTGPFKTFKVLRERVCLPKYRNVQFDFIRNS